MTQFIGQITVILESDTSSHASETLCLLAKQLDDCGPGVVFADHNGDVENYEIVEQECEQALITGGNRAAFPVLLASLENCATLLADYDEHPGEEGRAYREAIAAISQATIGGAPLEKHAAPGVVKSPALPPDPDGMNSDRAAWADKAISAFREATGTDAEDALPDLLADLMHWSDRADYDFGLALERAREHYEAETTGE